jgi:hypothetical protein
MMMDFIEHGSRDPFLFVDYAKSYYNFMLRVDRLDNQELSDYKINLLELFSKEINNAKRIEDSLILKILIESGELSIKNFKELIFKNYGYSISDDTIKSCVSNLNFEFIRKEEKIIFVKDNTFHFYEEFKGILDNSIFKRFLLDSIYYSIHAFDSAYKEEYYKNGLILYNKYSRKDVCRLLNWERDISSTIFGYRTHGGDTPCFFTYHKSDAIDSTINYNDHFINKSTFSWESRSNRKLDSDEIKGVINSSRILLFVKKEDGEGTDFYFMGDVSIIPDSIEQGSMPESNLPVVHFKFHLQQPVIQQRRENMNEPHHHQHQQNDQKKSFVNAQESKKNHVTFSV